MAARGWWPGISGVRSNATGPDAKLEMEAASGGEPLSQQRKQAATPGKQLLQPCRRPRCHAESCSGTFEGVKQQSRNTTKEAVPQAQTPSWMPQAKTPRWRWRQPAAMPEEQLVAAEAPCVGRSRGAVPQAQTSCWKLQRHFAGGSSSSLGTLEKEAVPQAQTPSSRWMPQAQTRRWRGRQPAATPEKQLVAAEAPCHRPRYHAGSCSGTFAGGQADSEH